MDRYTVVGIFPRKSALNISNFKHDGRWLCPRNHHRQPRAERSGLAKRENAKQADSIGCCFSMECPMRHREPYNLTYPAIALVSLVSLTGADPVESRMGGLAVGAQGAVSYGWSLSLWSDLFLESDSASASLVSDSASSFGSIACSQSFKFCFCSSVAFLNLLRFQVSEVLLAS